MIDYIDNGRDDYIIERFTNCSWEEKNAIGDLTILLTQVDLQGFSLWALIPNVFPSFRSLTDIFVIHSLAVWQTMIDQLRARRALSIFQDAPLRTRRALSLYKVYGDIALLVLNGTSLNSDSALLALNWRCEKVDTTITQGRRKFANC